MPQHDTTDSTRNDQTPDLSGLAESWTSPIIARSEVGRFSGGVLNARTMANHDSEGSGPAGRFRIGNKVVYPVDELIAWMESKAKSATIH